MDFFQLRERIEALCQALSIPNVFFPGPYPTILPITPEPRRSLCRRKSSGVFGTIHPLVAKKYGIQVEVLAAELAADALLQPPTL